MENFNIGDVVVCKVPNSEIYGKKFTVSKVERGGRIIHIKELNMSFVSIHFEIVDSSNKELEFDWDYTEWHIYIHSEEHFKHVKDFLASIGKPFPFGHSSVVQLTNKDCNGYVSSQVLWSDEWEPCSKNQIQVFPRTVYDVTYPKVIENKKIKD